MFKTIFFKLGFSCPRRTKVKFLKIEKTPGKYHFNHGSNPVLDQFFFQGVQSPQKLQPKPKFFTDLGSQAD
jgi:hypothetical protein